MDLCLASVAMRGALCSCFVEFCLVSWHILMNNDETVLQKCLKNLAGKPSGTGALLFGSWLSALIYSSFVSGLSINSRTYK